MIKDRSCEATILSLLLDEPAAGLDGAIYKQIS